MMKPPFDWHAALDTPRQRRRVGNLKRGWCSDRTENTILARHYDLRLLAAFVQGAELAPPTDTAHTHAALVVRGILRKGSTYAQNVVLQFVQNHPGRNTSVIRCVSTLRSWARYLHAKREVTCSLDAIARPQGRRAPPALEREVRRPRSRGGGLRATPPHHQNSRTAVPRRPRRGSRRGLGPFNLEAAPAAAPPVGGHRVRQRPRVPDLRLRPGPSPW